MHPLDSENHPKLNQLSIHPIHSVETGGLDYFFIEQGEGPVIFMLHGFPDMANTWDESITALSKTHRVIAPFLRGYYPTSIPEDRNYSVKKIAQDIIDLASKLGIKRFHVIGQDWGASIAYAMANLAPERIIRLVALAIPHPSVLKLTPKILFAGRHFIVFKSKKRALQVTKKDNFAYIDTLYRRWSPDFDDFARSSNAIKETFRHPGRLEAALGYYWSYFRDKAKKEMTLFYNQVPNVPVLFLAGENDIAVSKKILSDMETKMPKGSKVVLFRNAGHFLHREIFNQFIEEAQIFLSIEND